MDRPIAAVLGLVLGRRGHRDHEDRASDTGVNLLGTWEMSGTGDGPIGAASGNLNVTSEDHDLYALDLAGGTPAGVRPMASKLRPNYPLRA